MSFIYSQALVEASSPGKCSDTGLSVLSSGTPTPNLCLWHDKTTDVSRHSRYGMTCKPLTDDLGAELLTSWLAGFPVKTYPQPEKAQESTESAAECGRTWRGWLAKYDPSSSSWKTAQCSFIEDLGESLATFPRSGMTRGGLLWELPMLVHRTSVTGSGYLLPTPVSIDAGSGRINRSPSKGAKERPTLALMARKDLWPTPTCPNGGRSVAHVMDWRSQRTAYSASGKKVQIDLAQAVRMWPTPTAHNAKETNAKSEMNRNTPTLAAQAGGTLNPNWVEWLMGWPIGHTALKPSETARCHSALPKPSESLLEASE